MDEVGAVPSSSDGPSKERFLVGDLVEVRMLEKGLRGSWHPAKVVEVHKGKRMVEYEELLEEDEKSKLKELVAVGRASDGDNLMGTLPLKSPPKKSRPRLRPRPPTYPDSQPISWQEGVWVECFYEDAWWEGVLAENITNVDVDDVSLLTRKSEVDVLFPEENDLSKMRVDGMRVGQEWDEETGNWSLKGCVPVPVARPNKKRSSSKNTNNSEKQPAASPGVGSEHTDAAEAVNSADAKAAISPIELELCDTNALALNTLITDFCQSVETVRDNVISCSNNNSNTGYAYEERLNKLGQGGGSSNVSLNLGAQEPVNACPAREEPLVENEAEGNTPDDALDSENEDCQSPVERRVNAALQNEEAAQTLLTHSGWKVTRSASRKTGEVTWNCRSPKVAGAPAKTFSSLAEALSYEAHRGDPEGIITEATSLSQGCGLAETDCVTESSAMRDSATGEDEDENDEYAASARQILVRFGCEVFNSLRTGSDGQSVWLYRTPGEGTQTRKWFKNWRLAIEEFVKQETNPPNQKKRSGRVQNLSALPSRRVTRRLSSPEGVTKLPNGSAPSFMKSEDIPISMLPNLSAGDYSDVDMDDQTEVDIVFNSGRKRTSVDLGKQFTPSNMTSFAGNIYMEDPFGRISKFSQNDKAYTLQVTTHDFSKEQISVIVERGDMIIKARYGVEKQFDLIPVRCSGCVSSRITLPKDVEREKISAEFKTNLLTLTLPKCLSVPQDTLQIMIQ